MTSVVQSPESLQIKRDSRLESLLAELKKQDPLFERNIPAQYREEFDDETLLDHLRTTYAKEEFIIREESEVLKYAQTDDKVIAKKLIQHKPAIIKAYEECIVTKVSKDKKTVSIQTTERKTQQNIANVSIDKLILLGTKRFLDPDNYIDKQGRIGITIQYDRTEGKENLKQGIRCKGSIEKKDYVVFSEETYFGNLHIPEGSTGYILGRTTELLCIYWVKQKGLQNSTSFDASSRNYYSYYFFSPNEAIIVKRNFVNFDETYNEIYHPPEV